MDPLLLDIPEQIETERLFLRVPRPGEGAAVNAAVCESFEQLHLWMPWAATLPNESDTESHSRRALASFHARTDLQYRAWLKDTGAFVGSSGLHRIDWSVPRFEIGYWCRSSLVGQGYVSEVVRALTVLAQAGLNAERVEIRADERNQRSCRVAQRCGFDLEGVLRNDRRATDGTLRNTRVYSKIRP